MIDHKTLAALTGDQLKYFDFSLHWPDILSQQIPFGFPLFLRIVGWFSPSYGLLPYLSLTLWVTSLGFLVASLRHVRYRVPMILGIVGPLSLTIAMRPWNWHGNPYFYANTERLTVILSVVLFGLVLMRKDWQSSLVAFVMCLVRPAMLFVPVVVFLMRPSWRMALVVFSPFILFVGLRGLVVRDFAFCSYGAVQATRIYAPLVRQGDIDKIPGKYRTLVRDILKVKVNTDTILDRQSDRELYTDWMTGDKYQAAVYPYLKAHFKTDSDANAFLRGLWTYELRLHWRERLSLYKRAMRVAFGKFPDPTLILGLFFVLIARMLCRIVVNEDDSVCFYNMVRWSGLWLILSIASLLVVQFPDDRYMQISWFWVPSLLGSAIALVW